MVARDRQRAPWQRPPKPALKPASIGFFFVANMSGLWAHRLLDMEPEAPSMATETGGWYDLQVQISCHGK